MKTILASLPAQPNNQKSVINVNMAGTEVYELIVELEKAVKEQKEGKVRTLIDVIKNYLQKLAPLEPKNHLSILISISNCLGSALYAGYNYSIAKILYDCMPDKNMPQGCSKSILEGAVQNANSELIKFLLADNFDVNFVCNSGNSLLMEAIIYTTNLGQVTIINDILKYGPDIFYRNPKTNWSAIVYAIDQGKTPIIDSILKKADNSQKIEKLIADLSLEQEDFSNALPVYARAYINLKNQREGVKLQLLAMLEKTQLEKAILIYEGNDGRENGVENAINLNNKKSNVLLKI